jgi:hypothetical protein
MKKRHSRIKISAPVAPSVLDGFDRDPCDHLWAGSLRITPQFLKESAVAMAKDACVDEMNLEQPYLTNNVLSQTERITTLAREYANRPVPNSGFLQVNQIPTEASFSDENEENNALAYLEIETNSLPIISPRDEEGGDVQQMTPFNDGQESEDYNHIESGSDCDTHHNSCYSDSDSQPGSWTRQEENRESPLPQTRDLPVEDDNFIHHLAQRAKHLANNNHYIPHMHRGKLPHMYSTASIVSPDFEALQIETQPTSRNGLVPIEENCTVDDDELKVPSRLSESLVVVHRLCDGALAAARALKVDKLEI